MRGWLVDAGVAAAVFVAAAARVAAAPVLPGDRAPDGTAYALVAGMALVLLLRRRYPAPVIAVLGTLYLDYHVRGYPGGAPSVAVWAAMYSVAVARRRRLGLVLAAVLIVLDARGRMIVSGLGPLSVALDGSTGMFVAALLLGEVVRGRQARLALLAAERDRAAEQRVTQERIRIARELHDLSAHTLAVVSVQAGVADELLDEEPAQAPAALEAVSRAAREAMVELRAAVGVLRDGNRPREPEQPAPTLDRLPEIAAGTGATLVCEGTPRPLPRAVEATAYRILQEAVANAVRHSGAGHIEMRVGYLPDGLSLGCCLPTTRHWCARVSGYCWSGRRMSRWSPRRPTATRRSR